MLHSGKRVKDAGWKAGQFVVEELPVAALIYNRSSEKYNSYYKYCRDVSESNIPFGKLVRRLLLSSLYEANMKYIWMNSRA